MGMADISIDLRRRLVQAYRSKQSGTYAATAALFGVGESELASERCGWPCVRADGVIKKNGGRPGAGPPRCSSQARSVHLQPSGSRRRKADLPRRVWLSARLSSALWMGPVGEKSGGKANHGDWCTMTMIGAIAAGGWRSGLVRSTTANSLQGMTVLRTTNSPIRQSPMRRPLRLPSYGQTSFRRAWDSRWGNHRAARLAGWDQGMPGWGKGRCRPGAHPEHCLRPSHHRRWGCTWGSHTGWGLVGSHSDKQSLDRAEADRSADHRC
jgi:hypothetical protein